MFAAPAPHEYVGYGVGYGGRYGFGAAAPVAPPPATGFGERGGVDGVGWGWGWEGKGERGKERDGVLERERG